MELIAVEDKIIGCVVARENKLESGIIMIDHPGSGPASEEFIEVLSVGPKVELIKVGDIVITNPFAGKVFTVDRKQYKALHPMELYGILKN